MATTKISWTKGHDGTQGKTWNPVTGCSRVSPGCMNCYAERLSLKFGWSQKPWTANNSKENVVLHPERLDIPFTWKKPAMVFVNSMSDIFHEEIPNNFIDQIFAMMAQTPQHTYQILTKRPERMLKYMNQITRKMAIETQINMNLPVRDRVQITWPLPNCWLGVSVEDQRRADERIPLLLRTPAVVRFLSCEPLLGPINLKEYIKGLSWVICGGESGPEFRQMDLGWARSIRDQCVEADVPFWFKQIAAYHSETGKELDGVLWEQRPERRVDASS